MSLYNLREDMAGVAGERHEQGRGDEPRKERKKHCLRMSALYPS